MKKSNATLLFAILLAASEGSFADDMTCNPEWGFVDKVICRAVLVPVIVVGSIANVLRPIGNIFPDAYYSVNVTVDDNSPVPAEISIKCGKTIQASPRHTLRLNCAAARQAQDGRYCTLSDPSDNLAHGNLTTAILVSQEGVPDVRCLKLRKKETQ